MVVTKLRGHDIYCKNNIWYYKDNDEPTVGTVRKCGHCGKDKTEDGHDGCVGHLPGVMNACCGHGVENEAYVMFWYSKCIRGREAIEYIKKQGNQNK